MTNKSTDKQAIHNTSENFRGYAVLLRKIKQRVLIAQQRAIYAANDAQDVLGYWRHVATKSGCRRLGQENLATAGSGLEERLFRNKKILSPQYAVHDAVLQRI